MLSTVERPELTRRAETMFRISEYPIPAILRGSRLTDYLVNGALHVIPSIDWLMAASAPARSTPPSPAPVWNP